MLIDAAFICPQPTCSGRLLECRSTRASGDSECYWEFGEIPCGLHCERIHVLECLYTLWWRTLHLWLKNSVHEGVLLTNRSTRPTTDTFMSQFKKLGQT